MTPSIPGRSKKHEAVQNGLKALLLLLEEGGEFPDAAWMAAKEAGCDQGVLEKAYDEHCMEPEQRIGYMYLMSED